jgi:hypothetical protein
MTIEGTLGNYIGSGSNKTFQVYTAIDQYNRLHYLEESISRAVYQLSDANVENTATLIRFTKVVDEAQCMGPMELTPENAQSFYTLHPRCGTSFMVFVMVIAVLVHAFMGWPSLWLRVASRILVLPLIAGLSYELLKWAGRSDNIIVKILSLPGLYLQKLTTNEPDFDQLEVAIAATKAVLKDEDEVPYFEGIADLEGNPVEGEVEFYEPAP